MSRPAHPTPRLALLALLALLVVPALVAARPQVSAEEARAAWAADDRELALELGAQALAAQPDDLAWRRTLAGWQLATHRYAAALETAADQEALASERGRALYLLGRPAEALRHLPDDDLLDAVLRVDACETLGDDAATLAALERAEPLARSAPEQRAHLACVRGRLLARAARPAEAAESFRAALAAHPLEPGAHFGLGRALLQLGEREQALDVLARHRELVPLLDDLEAARRALDLAPRHAPNHAQLGDAERAVGRTAAARAAYEQGARLARDDELVPIVLRLARLLSEDLGDLDGAVSRLDGAAARVPDPRLSVRAGDLLAAAGRWEAAALRFERARELLPQDARVAERLREARRRAEGPR